MNKDKPYSEKDYLDAKSKGLDLDKWSEVQKQYMMEDLKFVKEMCL